MIVTKRYTNDVKNHMICSQRSPMGPVPYEVGPIGLNAMHYGRVMELQFILFPIRATPSRFLKPLTWEIMHCAFVANAQLTIDHFVLVNNVCDRLWVHFHFEIQRDYICSVNVRCSNRGSQIMPNGDPKRDSSLEVGRQTPAAAARPFRAP